jgi:hypothetical protein
VRSNVHDSNGPNIRVRGNAYQVMEKYLAMARDAAASGDRIAAENYYQHAEHYFRTLNASGGNGMGGHHHHMHTPSDPLGIDGDDMDDEQANGRQPGMDQRMDQRPMQHNQGGVRPNEQPRVDPARAEQPRTDMPPTTTPGAEAASGAPQPYDGRDQGGREHSGRDYDQRGRGPNGRRRHDGRGPRPMQGGQQPMGQGTPQRDPRSISPASPAEAASNEPDPTDPEKPGDI